MLASLALLLEERGILPQLRTLRPPQPTESPSRSAIHTRGPTINSIKVLSRDSSIPADPVPALLHASSRTFITQYFLTLELAETMLGADAAAKIIHDVVNDPIDLRLRRNECIVLHRLGL